MTELLTVVNYEGNLEEQTPEIIYYEGDYSECDKPQVIYIEGEPYIVDGVACIREEEYYAQEEADSAKEDYSECEKDVVIYSNGHFEVKENIYSNTYYEEEEEAPVIEEVFANPEHPVPADFPPCLTDADIAAFYESIEDSDIINAFEYFDLDPEAWAADREYAFYGDILCGEDEHDYLDYLTDADFDLYYAIEYVLDWADHDITAVMNYYERALDYFTDFVPDNFSKNHFYTILDACSIILRGAPDKYPDFIDDKDIDAYETIDYCTSGDNDFDEQSIIEIEAYLNSSSEEPTVETPDSGIIEAAEPVIEEPVIEEPEEPVIEEPVIEEAEEDFIEEDFIDEDEDEFIEDEFIDEDDEDGFDWSINDIEQPTESITEAVLPETAEQPEPANIMPEIENTSDNEEHDTEENNSALQIAEEEPSINAPAESTVNVTPDIVNDDEIFELFLSEHNEFKDILDSINNLYMDIVAKSNYISDNASKFRGKKYMRKSSTAFIERFTEDFSKLLSYARDTKECLIYAIKLGRLNRLDYYYKELNDIEYQFNHGLDILSHAEKSYSGCTKLSFTAI